MSAHQFDCGGLGDEWEASGSIRTRLRNGENLLVSVKPKGKTSTIAECVANQDVLQPALGRLFVSKNLKLPNISLLRDQVEIAYAKRQRTPDEADIDDSAWDIRIMMKLIKRKAVRSEPSFDARLKR